MLIIQLSVKKNNAQTHRIDSENNMKFFQKRILMAFVKNQGVYKSFAKESKLSGFLWYINNGSTEITDWTY